MRSTLDSDSSLRVIPVFGVFGEGDGGGVSQSKKAVSFIECSAQLVGFSLDGEVIPTSMPSVTRLLFELFFG